MGLRRRWGVQVKDGKVLSGNGARMDAETVQVVEIRENEAVISISELERLRAELSSLKQERDRAASGKLNCADCGSILARR